MNDAHLHLLVNHLPIVGLLIGTLVLIAGLTLKKREIKLTAFGIYIFSALGSLAANATGEAAEEIVENISGISETLIHTHEEYAETYLVLSLVLGAISLLGFLAELRKMKFASVLTFFIFLFALATSVSAKYVGTSGGEIRHSEIRSSAKAIHIEHHDGDD
jgi:glucan phosphoethanolaminetransferase (alkaline phosphatase superfamily)